MSAIATRVDWSLAPPWAQWWAMDHDGEAFWYERMPFVCSGHRDWSSSRGRVTLAPGGDPFNTRWQDSLAQRQA